MTLVLAGCFLIAALVVPMPASSRARAAMDVSRSLDELRDQVEVLEQERILPTPEADRVRDAMQQIGEEATGRDPAKTWEALDHLADQLDQAGDDASELARQRQEEAAGAKALAEALQQGGEAPEP